MGILSKEVFQVTLITYLILLLLENLQTGFVSNFIDLNWLLPIILISGIAMALLGAEEEPKNKKFNEFDLYFIVLLTISSGLLIFYKTKELGWLSYLIAATTSLIIFILSILIFVDKSKT
jgi:hypothetical protein